MNELKESIDIYIGNIPSSLSIENLIINKIKNISKLRIVRKKDKNEPEDSLSGFMYLTFELNEYAEEAMKYLNSNDLQSYGIICEKAIKRTKSISNNKVDNPIYLLQEINNEIMNQTQEMSQTTKSKDPLYKKRKLNNLKDESMSDEDDDDDDKYLRNISQQFL